jgi:ribosome recycling factor
MIDSRIQHFIDEAQKIIDYLHSEFGKLQTGRANAGLVEHVMVEAYGQNQELKAVAGITVESAHSIIITPWDKTILKEVEDALATADLGINPQNDGVAIRMTMPSMTEERRKEIGKIAHELGEHARISIRQQRQKAHDAFKEEADEDEHRRLDKELQAQVDDFNKRVETDVKHKQEEILKV